MIITISLVNKKLLLNITILFNMIEFNYILLITTKLLLDILFVLNLIINL